MKKKLLAEFYRRSFKYWSHMTKSDVYQLYFQNIAPILCHLAVIIAQTSAIIIIRRKQDQYQYQQLSEVWTVTIRPDENTKSSPDIKTPWPNRHYYTYGKANVPIKILEMSILALNYTIYRKKDEKKKEAG